MGTYTQISIDAPDSAEAGSWVPVTVNVKNLYHTGIYVTLVAKWGYTEFIRVENWVISAGHTLGFAGSFRMPSQSVTIHAECYYKGTDGKFYLDDQKDKEIRLPAEVEVAFSDLRVTDWRRR